MIQSDIILTHLPSGVCVAFEDGCDLKRLIKAVPTCDRLRPWILTSFTSPSGRGLRETSEKLLFAN
jgi:hypothetical protein